MDRAVWPGRGIRCADSQVGEESTNDVLISKLGSRIRAVIVPGLKTAETDRSADSVTFDQKDLRDSSTVAWMGRNDTNPDISKISRM